MDIEHVVDLEAPDANLQFIKTLHDNNFSVLVNHSINIELIERVFAGWKDFFNSENKLDYIYDHTSLAGYFPYGLEKPKSGKPADPKEYYYFYVNGKCPENLRKDTLQFHQGLFELGTKLLAWIQASLPEAISQQLSMPLVEMVKFTPRAVLRMLHYPPVLSAQDGPSGACRAAEHEDLTLLTLVQAPSGKGLQSLDKAGNWHDVEPGVHRLAVHLGDLLAICTKGYYKATTHRVLSLPENAGLSRYSSAFFLNPRDEVMIDAEHSAVSYLQQHIKKKLNY